MTRNLTLLTAALFAFSTVSTHAAVVAPTAASATSSIDAARNLTETINGDGLSGVGDILTQTHSITNGSSEYWLGTFNDTQVLDFTLAGPTTIGSLHLWNYYRNADPWDNRALQSFTMLFSDDSGSTYTAGSVNVSGLDGGVGAYGTGPIPVQTVEFTPIANVTNIRFTNVTNHGATDWYGLGEVRFNTEGSGPVIPAPAGLPAGLALLGIVGLRRRRA